MKKTTFTTMKPIGLNKFRYKSILSDLNYAIEEYLTGDRCILYNTPNKELIKIDKGKDITIVNNHFNLHYEKEFVIDCFYTEEKIIAIDILEFLGFDVRDFPLYKRKEILDVLIQKINSQYYTAINYYIGNEEYKRNIINNFLASNKKGAILKNIDSKYYNWIAPKFTWFYIKF